MKAITLWQPYATLIAIGAKPFETRSRHPGEARIGTRVAIHAAQREVKPSRDIDAAAHHDMRRALARAGLTLDDLPLGKIVCTAVIDGAVRVDPASEFVRCPPDRFGDYRVGRWVWRLADVRALVHPVPWSGKQNWFDVPDDIGIVGRAVARQSTTLEERAPR